MEQKSYKIYEMPEYLSEYFCDIAEIDTNSSVLIHSKEQNIYDAVIRRNPKNILDNTQHENYNKAIINTLFEELNVDAVIQSYKNLQNGGVLVVIMNVNFFMSTDDASASFKNLLIRNRATIKELPDAAFQETNAIIKACIVKLTKIT